MTRTARDSEGVSPTRGANSWTVAWIVQPARQGKRAPAPGSQIPAQNPRVREQLIERLMARVGPLPGE